MKKPFKILFVSTLLLSQVTFTAQADKHSSETAENTIRFTLQNGLTVVLNEDKQSPHVAFSKWYKVGSGDEDIGNTGFAHLFEHLYFTGSMNATENHFEQLQAIGGLEINGTTNHDRTRFFQTIPKNALDYTLWLESERMVGISDAITEEKLTSQKKAIQSESELRAGDVFQTMMNTLGHWSYPKDHPYHFPVMGSMQDVNSATLKATKSWLARYYTPNNAVIALSGDLDIPTTKTLIQKYFSHIPSGTVLSNVTQWIAPLNSEIQVSESLNLGSQQTVLSWNVPGMKHQQFEALNLLATLLNQSDNPLVHRMMNEDALVSSISTLYSAKEVGAQFVIAMERKPGVSTTALLQQFDKIWAELTQFDEKLIALGKKSVLANNTRQMQTISGATGKANLLASGEVYFDDHLYYFKRNTIINQLTSEDLSTVKNQWLGNNKLVIDYSIDESETQSEPEHARITTAPKISQPQKTELVGFNTSLINDSLKVSVLTRENSQDLSVALAFNQGFLNDAKTTPGLLNVSLKALELALTSQGFPSQMISEADHSIVLSSLKPAEIARYLSLIMQLKSEKTALSAAEAEVAIANNLERLALEEQDIESIATKALAAIYRHNNETLPPLTGYGDQASLKKLPVSAVQIFTNNLLNHSLSNINFVGKTDVGIFNLPIFAKLAPTKQKKEMVYISKAQQGSVTPLITEVDIGNQTLILASKIIEHGQFKRLSLQTANQLFGVGMSARLNQLIRDKKGWSYGGVSKIIRLNNTQSLWVIMAPVKPEFATDALTGLQQFVASEQQGFAMTDKELKGVKAQQRSLFNKSFDQNMTANLRLMSGLLEGTLETDLKLEHELDSLLKEDIQLVMQNLLEPNNFSWQILGQIDQFETNTKQF